MKKLKKVLAMALLTVSASLLFACGEKEEALTLKTIIPTETNMKTIGRTGFIKDTIWMVQSGSGVEFTFLGTSASITLQGDGSVLGPVENKAHFAIYVNGEEVVNDMMDKLEKTYTVFESEEEQQCTIKVLKLSECAQSTMGIKSVDVTSKGDIAPTENKEKLIEFIGDSITCGYGVEDEDRDHHFKTETENATKAYAYKTAQALDADYSLVSFSGHGIISGYTANGTQVPEQTVPQYYEKLGFSYASYQGAKPESKYWDFTKRQPDVIVINLGTNDDSYTGTKKDRQDDYAKNYVDFIEQVRKKNPDATIVCALGIMGDRLFPKVEEAVETYKTSSGDSNVYALKFDVQQEADGYAADWHPTEKTHTKAAEKLTAELKKIMNW